MQPHLGTVRAAAGLVADGINLKRRARGSTALSAEAAVAAAVRWLRDHTLQFVQATPMGAPPAARFTAAARVLLAKAAEYGRQPDPPPALGGDMDVAMASLPASAPKRKEAEMEDTQPHSAHSHPPSVHSVSGVVAALQAAEWMDETPAGNTLTPLSMEATRRRPGGGLPGGHAGRRQPPGHSFRGCRPPRGHRG